MDECLTCGKPFVPRPLHPMVTSAWCDECLKKERIEAMEALEGSKDEIRIRTPSSC